MPINLLPRAIRVSPARKIVAVRKRRDGALERQDLQLLLIPPLPGTLGVGAEVALVPDTNTAPAAGKSRLRLLNAASGTGTLDGYVTLPGVDLASIAPAVSGLSPAGPTKYLELEPGTYDVRLTTFGTKTVVIIAGNVTLAVGQVRTFVVLPTRIGGFTTTSVILPDRDP